MGRQGRIPRQCLISRPARNSSARCAHRASVEPRIHTLAVELDLVQPLVAFGAALASCVSRGATNAGSVSGLLRRRRAMARGMGKEGAVY